MTFLVHLRETIGERDRRGWLAVGCRAASARRLAFRLGRWLVALAWALASEPNFRGYRTYTVSYLLEAFLFSVDV